MADFEVNKRLKKIIEEVYKTTPHKFSMLYNDTGGVKTSQVLRERNGLSSNLLEQILKAYPEINRTWLLTGEGQMIKTTQNNSALEEPKEIYDKNNLIEIYQMMKQLVESNSKLSTGIENITESNKLLAANSSKIVDSIQNITENNNILAKTNQILAKSNATLTTELQGRGKDAEAAGCADAG